VRELRESAARAADGQYARRLIPTKNAKSLWAYYLGFLSLFACVPLIGIVVVTGGGRGAGHGIKARRYAIEYPEAKGGIHAWVGILMASRV